MVGVRGWFSDRRAVRSPEGWGTTRVAKATLRANQPRLTLARSHDQYSIPRRAPGPNAPPLSIARPLVPPRHPSALLTEPFSAPSSPYVPLHARITVDHHKPTLSRSSLIPLSSSLSVISRFPSLRLSLDVSLHCALYLYSSTLSCLFRWICLENLILYCSVVFKMLLIWFIYELLCYIIFTCIFDLQRESKQYLIQIYNYN